MTGKEKTSAAKPVHDAVAVGGAVSDGECDVIGKQESPSFHLDLVWPNFQRCRRCRTALK